MKETKKLTKKISIIMPVYNEKATIQHIVDRINNNIKLQDLDKELIIINDGSTDMTGEIIKKKLLPQYNNIIYIETGKNEGKGNAIKLAIRHIKGDIVIIQDADLEYDPSEYPKLIEPILSKETKVVYGSRFLHNPPVKSANLFYKIGGRIITHFFNLLYQTRITDEATCYKVFDAQLLKSIYLQCRRFEFCPEVTAKIIRLGYTIKEVPISYIPRTLKEGKKIKFLDALIAILTMIKFRFISKEGFVVRTKGSKNNV